MQKNTWICLRCKNKWVNHNKKDPRTCPLCGSCTIYLPRIIKRQKKDIGALAPLT